MQIDGVANNTQKFSANIAGWAYNVVENPSGAVEIRWVMWAWKKPAGSDGIMIQFADNGGWGAVAAPFVDPPAPGTRRYIAGLNATGWTGIQVAENAPVEWAVNVRDLWADFTDFTLTGVAFTPFDGTGIYDTFYIAQTEAELEEVLPVVFPVEPAGKATTAWARLKTE